MKYVKKTISLPKDILEFAQKDAERKAKEHGEEPNLSRYVRQLIRSAKGQKPAA